MTRYAEGTDVTPVRSRVEIERLLEQHGATGFAFGTEADRAMIAFRMKNRHIRMSLIYPPLSDFKRSAGGRVWYTADQQQKARDAEIRRLWRELVLLLKAKLVAIQSKITSFEKEFMADTLLPDGSIVFEWLEPQLEDAYRSGRMPPLLPGMNAQKLIGPGYIDGEVV